MGILQFAKTIATDHWSYIICLCYVGSGYAGAVNDILRHFTGFNALTSLSADRLRLVGDMQPAIELACRHEELMRPFLESARQYEEAMRPMLEAARRYKDATGPLIEAAQKQQDAIRRISEAFQVNGPALELASQVHLPQMQLAETLGKTMALSGVVDEGRRISELTKRWRATFDRFGDLTKLVPTNAFADMQRIAESVRLSMPVFPALDSSLLGGTLSADLVDAVQRFRDHAESVANDPDAGIEDVEALVAEAQAVNAAAPVEARSHINGYLLFLFLWLLDKAAEDPAKELIHNAVAALILVLTTVVPPDLPPRPAVAVPGIEAPAAPPDDGMIAPPDTSQKDGLPDIIRRAGPDAERLTLGFLNGIRNTNTRQAYEAAVMRFADWCDDRNLGLTDITPFVVRAYIKQMQREYATRTVKQHLAAIRLLFDHLIVGGVLPVNPSAAVRPPQQGARNNTRTPPLRPLEARVLLESIRESDRSAVRDRALLSVIACTGPRVSSVVAMDAGDYFRDDGHKQLRLRERGGALRDVPVGHTAERYLDAYVEAAGIAAQPASPLWRTMTKERGFSDRRMSRVDVFRMIRRRMKDAAPASAPNGEAGIEDTDKGGN